MDRAGATILPGITFGDSAVVGATCVVTKDVTANTIVAGNPAKVIKTIDDKPENVRSKEQIEIEGFLRRVPNLKTNYLTDDKSEIS